MTIENSEETSHVGASDPAEPQAPEASSGATDSVPNLVSASEPAQAAAAHDSTPSMARKLAPPPKPKRDSGAASAPPSGRPPDGPDLLASASALKAPIAPAISFTGQGVPTLDNPASAAAEPSLAEAPSAVAPLSQPPPMRRRSYPSFPEVGDAKVSASTASKSDPALAEGDASNANSAALRPIAAPPRPRSDPPGPRLRDSSPSVPDSAAPRSSAPASSPPSSSAIFAMRIIAVGDSVRPPAAGEQVPEVDPDSYPPSASRLGTTVRRSSRPPPAPVVVPPPAAAPTEVISPARPSAPSIEIDVPIDVELPVAVAKPSAVDVAAVLDAAAAVLEASSVEAPAPSIPLEARRPPAPPPPVELSDDQFSAEAIAKKIAAAEASEAAAEAQAAEELGREDAISMEPEEVAALGDAAKPPPPPKRALGGGASAPPAVESAVAAAPSAPAPSTPSAPSAPSALSAPSAPSPPSKDPTPDLAAAKAAQRSKTRQPWWEDLFNEDFMRASSRVSDEHVRREVTFIEESLGVAAGGVVLDLGCGAGHHAVEFASRGYGVVGYDLSLYQLALAADVAQERGQKINFLQGDMREMAFEEMFDGVFCWNTTFGYFEEDKNLAVAQRVFKALRPGGMFLIDVLNRDFAAASAPCTVWYEGDSCVCMDDMSVDWISSRLRVKRSIILDDGRTKESLFSLRLYSLHELGKLLHEVGFRVTEASGHPATPGVFFGPNSPRIIMLAQRP